MFLGPHTRSQSPKKRPAAGAEQHQPLGKMKVLAGLQISLQSPPQPETQQSQVLSAQPAPKEKPLLPQSCPGYLSPSSWYLVQ